jgi:hypothetical protein
MNNDPTEISGLAARDLRLELSGLPYIELLAHAEVIE